VNKVTSVAALEPGINPLSEEEILSFFDLTQILLDA